MEIFQSDHCSLKQTQEDALEQISSCTLLAQHMNYPTRCTLDP